MGNTTNITRTLITKIKESLGNESFKWKDTGKFISFKELLFSLSKDNRITKV